MKKGMIALALSATIIAFASTAYAAGSNVAERFHNHTVTTQGEKAECTQATQGNTVK